MKARTLITAAVALACAATISAAPARANKRGPVGADGGAAVAKGRDAYVNVDTPARPGGTCLATAPNLQATGSLLPPLGGKPRRWIVLEMKYTTQAKWQDELMFTWHVLLDSTKATDKDPKNLPPLLSYYTTTVRYVDVKKGSHMASVCLPPSVYERFGEPCTVSVLVTNKEGDELVFHTENQWSKLPTGGNGKWWENDKLMSWQDQKKDGKQGLERRQGLLDRSKTPFYLVNNADYELVQQ